MKRADTSVYDICYAQNSQTPLKCIGGVAKLG